MFSPKEFKPWIVALNIPALSNVGPGGLKPSTQAGTAVPGTAAPTAAQAEAPGVPGREAPPPPPRPEAEEGKGAGEGGEGRKATRPPHSQTHTLEPLLQSKRPTYPVSHLPGPLITATLTKKYLFGVCTGVRKPREGERCDPSGWRKEAPGRRHPRAAAVVATAGSGAPQPLFPALSVVVGAGSGVGGGERGAIASGEPGREGEGAAEDRRSRRLALGAGSWSRAGRGRSCWRGRRRGARGGGRGAGCPPAQPT